MTRAPDIAAVLADTQAAQARASDPEVSAWVSANAGAGKTHVLKLRVLRLLLSGTPPERILCLTYTKAAAAEMAKRVFDDLARWATADDDQLAAIISDLVGSQPTADDLRFARQLFARAIETPGGLKVQTIHAFCERLLHRFPLEAQVPPGFTPLDEGEAAELIRDAIDAVLDEAAARPETELGQALRTAVVRAADQRFDDVLGEVLRHRRWVQDMARLHESRGGRPFAAVEAYYRHLFGVRDGVDTAGLESDMAHVLSDGQIAAAVSMLSGGGKLDLTLADNLAAAVRATNRGGRVLAFANAFLTRASEPRSDNRFISKAAQGADPAIADMVRGARDTFHALKVERVALESVALTVALLRLAARVLDRYTVAKARRATLDFDDLIAGAARLLVMSDAADWVLYKLDGGLDHILVDEAQDTSPAQWTIIEALAAEFYSGEGASDVRRTVFAVGDEKQSIYSFQGAAPERFARAGQQFEALAEAAGQHWASVPLTLSFRTVAPLLAAVDSVFCDVQRAPGVSVSGGEVHHTARRIGEAGVFEVWPTVVPEDHAPAPAFAPLDDQAPGAPARQLAEGIAARIKRWLDTGEELVSQGRAVRASDILILVRRRQPFAPEMVRALKALDIAVAGADRIVLTEQIVVQDLMALGDFLALPEDDLSLAAVLKSPLFNLDDEDLLAVAPKRRGSLWSALLEAARSNDRLRPAAEMLKRWRGQSDFLPPYEFFATVLDKDGCRARLIGRLGPDAADPLDEFMNLALTYDDQAPASLQGFLSWLREGRREIKRNMDHGRDEVRVMTVHGAKGLEAPIVILPDTCSAPGGGIAPALVDLAGAEVPGQQASPLAWAVKEARQLTPVADGLAVRRQRERDEHNRLLYVALTRARDRIYVGGFETTAGRQKGCWYDTIQQGLSDDLTEVTLDNGETVWRITSPQTARVDKPDSAQPSSEDAIALPVWAGKPAPPEPQLTIPLAPSRLAPLESDEEGEPAGLEDMRQANGQPDEPAVASPRAKGGHDRFQRGLLTHALLEHLPGHPPETHRQVAEGFLARRGGALGPAVHRGIVGEVLKVLADPVFAPVFAPGSRAEVAIVAEIAPPHGDGPALKVNGQIDRLVQTADGILIVDYKTNRAPPISVDQVPAVYLLQLAAYRLALQQIFPDQRVQAALLWTDGGHLMAIGDDLLDDHQQRLWSLKGADLDA